MTPSPNHPSTPLVTVRCMTYNHEPYIRQCLEGIVKQQTRFAFEAVVHDDASTDGTADIVREYAARYPHLIKPILQTENQYSKKNGSVTRAINEHTRGKYVAVCEGDDYWTDPFKLQTQVDYLEQHPECGLVYTNVDFYFQRGQRLEKNYLTSGKVNHSSSFSDHLARAGYIAPCTWVYRSKYQFQLRKRYVDATFPLALDVWADATIHFIDRSTTVYRVLEESVSHSSSLQKRFYFGHGVFQIQKDYLEKYAALLSDDFRQAVYSKGYAQLLPAAIVLRQHALMDEARQFLNTRFSFRTWVLLKLRNVSLLRVLFILLYKRRGIVLP